MNDFDIEEVELPIEKVKRFKKKPNAGPDLILREKKMQEFLKTTEDKKLKYTYDDLG